MFIPEIKSNIGEDICLLVKLSNHPWNYICECGDASGLTVKEAQNTHAVFISHTHIDHFVNFDTILRHQIGINRKVIICGPAGIAKQVQARIKSYTWNLIQEDAIIYEIREVLSDNEVKVFELKPPMWKLVETRSAEGNILLKEESFKVSFILLDHKIPTLAYKFEENDTVKIDLQSSDFPPGKWVKDLKTAFENDAPEQPISVNGIACVAGDLFHLMHIQKGDSLGIIMDHAAHSENHERIAHHFSGCNTVFIESFYKDKDKEQAVVNFHSYASMSGKIMREAKIGNAIPVHFSRKYKEEDIRELVAEFEKSWKNKQSDIE